MNAEHNPGDDSIIYEQSADNSMILDPQDLIDNNEQKILLEKEAKIIELEKQIRYLDFTHKQEIQKIKGELSIKNNKLNSLVNDTNTHEKYLKNLVSSLQHNISTKNIEIIEIREKELNEKKKKASVKMEHCKSFKENDIVENVLTNLINSKCSSPLTAEYKKKNSLGEKFSGSKSINRYEDLLYLIKEIKDERDQLKIEYDRLHESAIDALVEKEKELQEAILKIENFEDLLQEQQEIKNEEIGLIEEKKRILEYEKDEMENNFNEKINSLEEELIKVKENYEELETLYHQEKYNDTLRYQFLIEETEKNKDGINENILILEEELKKAESNYNSLLNKFNMNEKNHKQIISENNKQIDELIKTSLAKMQQKTKEEELRNNVHKCKEQLAVKEEEIAKKNKEIKSIKEKKKSLKIKIFTFENDIKKLNNRINSLQSENNETKEFNQAFQDRSEQIIKDLENQIEELLSKPNKSENITTNIINISNNFIENEPSPDKETLLKQIIELTPETKNFLNSEELWQKEINDLKNENEELKQNIEIMDKEHKAILKSEKKKYQLDISQFQNKIKEIKDNINIYSPDYFNEINRLREENKELEKKNETYENAIFSTSETWAAENNYLRDELLFAEQKAKEAKLAYAKLSIEMDNLKLAFKNIRKGQKRSTFQRIFSLFKN